MGQSGWGGAKYVPTDRIIKKVDDSINIVNNVGSVIKSVNDVVKKETTEDLGEQLTNIVKYIYNLSNKESLVTKKMWLDKIPETILLNNIKQKYNYKPTPWLINPVIGEYDNPSAQSQEILNLNLSDGNTIIYGKGGSGKENLLTTTIWSTCIEHTPDEVSFYIIDCGAEILKMFYKFPHVGDIATVDEQDKIINILSYAGEEIERRKDAYADYAGSYKNYCENSGNKDPLLVFIINNYEIFSETYAKIADGIQTMYRDGAKYGIYFILSCTTTTSVRGRTTQYFNNRISLQLPDGTDYRSLVGSPRNLVPAKNFGRGLISKDETAYEFQTANISDLKEVNNVIRSAAEQLNAGYTTRAKKLKTVPEVVTLNDVQTNNMTLSNLPIGYDINTKDVYSYNFSQNKFNMIVGNNLPQNFSFITALIKQIKKLSNINFKIIDFVESLEPNFENTKIIELKPDMAITKTGKIRAKKIIVATHFPFINKHGSFFLKMYQHRSYVLALKNASDINGMYVDEALKGLSFRKYNDILLLGGGSHRTGCNGGGWAELEIIQKKYFPNSMVIDKWATQDCMTLDSISYIGKYSKSTPDFYVATGFNKWGMTSSMVAAMLLKDMICERRNELSELYSPSRTMLHPQLAINFFESAKNLLTPTAPRCPHLGCALKYNKAEHSWDCPCHGSRFEENGNLIDNPATDDIDKMK